MHIYVQGDFYGLKRIRFQAQRSSKYNRPEEGFGYVQDVTADLESGIITSIIVPGTNSKLSIFAGNNDIVIPWKNIKCIRR